jgi:hypothetical protein
MKPGRKLTPAKDAQRLPNGMFDRYDIVHDTSEGSEYRWHHPRREGLCTFDPERGQWGYSFMVIGGPDVWVGADTPAAGAMAVLKEEGRIVREQYEYERANGWSTD